MPFPLAHPAAILPLSRFCPRVLSFPGLVIGSIIPDAGYLFGSNADRFSHRFIGSFAFCLPVGLAVLAAWHSEFNAKIQRRRGAKGRTEFSSRKISHRLMTVRNGTLAVKSLAALRLCALALKSLLVVSLSILIGAWTHLVWDSFTNNHGWFVERFATLRSPVLSIAGHEVRVCHLLWYASSFVGVALLCLAYDKWARMNGGRSADFQSAVSPISNRQARSLFQAPGLPEALQAGSPAIQQIGNLRYFRAAVAGGLVLPIGAAHHLTGGVGGKLLVGSLSVCLVLGIMAIVGGKGAAKSFEHGRLR